VLPASPLQKREPVRERFLSVHSHSSFHRLIAVAVTPEPALVCQKFYHAFGKKQAFELKI
jgi:hypothetical protein